MNLQLSDGTTLQLPDDATPDIIRNLSARGEAWIKSNPQQAPAAPRPDPLSSNQTERRIWSNVVTAIPDTAITAANAIGAPGRYIGGKVANWMYGEDKPTPAGIPHLGPMLRSAAGIEELPANASATRRILESSAAALPYAALPAAGAAAGAETVLGGVGRGIASLAGNTLGQAALSEGGAAAGGAAGGAIGERVAGPAGRQVGTQIGSQIGATLPLAIPAGQAAARNYTANKYAGLARPDAPEIAAAADRAGIPQTPEMLGNDAVQRRVMQLEARPGSGPYIAEQRAAARNAATQAAFDAAERRAGLLGPSENPSATGSTITEMASQAANDLSARSGAAQQALMDRIGPRTPVDTSPMLADVARISRQTDPNTFQPIKQRARAVWDMLIQEQGNPPTTANLPYERVKDWRTNLRTRQQGLDPVPGRFSGQLYNSVTGAMEDAAASRGVPPPVFRDVQMRTRNIEGPGGYVERLNEIPAEPQAAYNYVMRGGEQNPQRLKDFAVPNMGDPRLDRVMGGHLRQLALETLGKNAPGAGNFAQRVGNTADLSKDLIYGGERPMIEDIARAAGAMNRKTTQGGTTRMVQDTMHGAIGPPVTAAIGALASGGVPPWLGALLGYLGRGQINLAQTRGAAGLEMGPFSKAAMSAMARGPQPAPQLPVPFRQRITEPDIQRLLAAIAAMQATQSKRPGY